MVNEVNEVNKNVENETKIEEVSFTCQYCGEEYSLTEKEKKEIDIEGMYDPTSYCCSDCAKDDEDDKSGIPIDDEDEDENEDEDEDENEDEESENIDSENNDDEDDENDWEE